MIVGLALCCMMHAPFGLSWCWLLQDIMECLSDPVRAKLRMGTAEPGPLSRYSHAGTEAGLVALAEAVCSLHTLGRHRLKEPAAADWERVPGCKQTAAAVAAGGRPVSVMVVAHKLLPLAAHMRPVGPVPVSRNFHLQTHQLAWFVDRQAVS